MILKFQADPLVLSTRPNDNLRTGIAVRCSVFEDIVKHAGELVRISLNAQALFRLHPDALVRRQKNGIKFIRHLFQHEGEADFLLAQRHRLQVEADDVEQFVDQALQATGLF